ncbi:acyltransferase domain-containing protein [Streptomyces sp. NPDC096048]|uniref:acyltransferase domain-containing protein n=1 Tax=Streptomyces sp. NPDC096048 TaxID=3366072 RepID=UPI0037FECB53
MPQHRPCLPDADDLPDVLLDLAVPHEDINELVGLRGRVTRDAGTVRLLEECVQELVRDLGEPAADPEGVRRFGKRPAEAPEALGGYFAA